MHLVVDSSAAITELGLMTPMNQLDADARKILAAAQRLATDAGHRYLLSGDVLVAAWRDNTHVRERLAEHLPLELEALRQAYELELESRPPALQDDPPTLVSEAIAAAASRKSSSASVPLSTVLAEMFRVADSMASRIVRRLGLDNKQAATLLDQ